MKRRLIALLLVFALLCPLLAVGAAADYTVYITDTGEKYHNYGCRYLSESCRPISASSARAMGYTPCSVCKAPVAEPEQTGFVDVAPNKYYSRPSIGRSKRASQTALIRATLALSRHAHAAR